MKKFTLPKVIGEFQELVLCRIEKKKPKKEEVKRGLIVPNQEPQEAGFGNEAGGMMLPRIEFNEKLPQGRDIPMLIPPPHGQYSGLEPMQRNENNFETNIFLPNQVPQVAGFGNETQAMMLRGGYNQQLQQQQDIPTLPPLPQGQDSTFQPMLNNDFTILRNGYNSTMQNNFMRQSNDYYYSMIQNDFMRQTNDYYSMIQNDFMRQTNDYYSMIQNDFMRQINDDGTEDDEMFDIDELLASLTPEQQDAGVHVNQDHTTVMFNDNTNYGPP